MVVAGLPILRVELTQANARILPRTASARQVDDAVAKRFASNPADRIVVVAPNRPTARAAARQLGRDHAIATVEQPIRVGHGVFRVDALLAVDPYSDAALDAVRNARNEPLGEEGAHRGSAGRAGRSEAQLGHASAAGPGIHRPLHGVDPLPDDRIRRPAADRAADEHPDRQRRVRGARLRLPGRPPRGHARLHEPVRPRHLDADPALRRGLRPVHRLRRVPASADRGGPPAYRDGGCGDRRRTGLERPSDHRRGRAVRRGDGSVRLLRPDLREGGRRRGGGRRTRRRDDRQSVPPAGHTRIARRAAWWSPRWLGRRQQAELS